MKTPQFYTDLFLLSFKSDPYGGAGTADCVATSRSVMKHFFADVLPFLYCCKLLGGEACDDYYDKRPPVSSDGYQPPRPPAQTQGDTHLRTFDGVKYDFNGSGEYIAFCANTADGPSLSTCDPSLQRLIGGQDLLEVRLRFSPLNPGNAGTVTKAIALADPLHRNGESAITVLLHPTRRVDIYDGSTRLIFPDVISQETTVVLNSGLIVRRTANLNLSDPVQVTVLTPSGLRLEALLIAGMVTVTSPGTTNASVHV